MYCRRRPACSTARRNPAADSMQWNVPMHVSLHRVALPVNGFHTAASADHGLHGVHVLGFIYVDAALGGVGVQPEAVGLERGGNVLHILGS